MSEIDFNQELNDALGILHYTRARFAVPEDMVAGEVIDFNSLIYTPQGIQDLKDLPEEDVELVVQQNLAIRDFLYLKKTYRFTKFWHICNERLKEISAISRGYLCMLFRHLTQNENAISIEFGRTSEDNVYARTKTDIMRLCGHTDKKRFNDLFNGWKEKRFIGSWDVTGYEKFYLNPAVAFNGDRCPKSLVTNFGEHFDSGVMKMFHSAINHHRQEKAIETKRQRRLASGK